MKKIIIIFFCSVFFLSSIYAQKEEVKFESCIDGDTIKIIINDKKSTVRFLAIDTPETKHPKKGIEPYGKEASEYTCNRVKNAKKIEIEYDKNSSKTDKYERLLGWIFVDGSLLQKELVQKGYAKIAYLYGDYTYTDELKKEEEIAKKNKLGIWNLDENQDDVQTQNVNSKEEKTLIEEILDKIIISIKKSINNLFKKIKSELKKEIIKIFD